MGILDNIGIGKRLTRAATPAPRARAREGVPAGSSGPGAPTGGSGRPGQPGGGRPATPPSGPPAKRRKGKRGAAPSPRERVVAAAAPLHDRRRRLVAARETTLRDLGGLMLEMYKRNRFREELLLDKCEEVLAIEVEVAHVDQRLFQLAPPNAAGMRPIGRCECGAPIHPGQNFCGVCGRGFSTLTQSRTCTRCGSGLRQGDQFCATCGSEAPDVLQALEAPASNRPGTGSLDPMSVAASAVADTVVIEVPSLDDSDLAPPPLGGEPPLVHIAGSPTAPATDLTPPPAWDAPAPAPEAAMDAAVAAATAQPAVPAAATAPAATPKREARPRPGADVEDKKLAKAEAKRQAAEQAARAKAAKARAKAKAKQARAARKRGDGA